MTDDILSVLVDTFQIEQLDTAIRPALSTSHAMPDRWLYLTGAPSLQQLRQASTDAALQRNGPTASRWLDAKNSTPDEPMMSHNHAAGDPIIHETLDGVTDEASSQIQAVLFEKSRMVAEESYHRLGRHSLAIPQARQAESQKETQMEYSESLLPPATQRRGGEGTFNQTTMEESLMNIPNWSFLLSEITRLDALAKVASGSRVNLLALISDLDPPSTIPLKKPSRSGKIQAVRASMTLLEPSGGTLDIVMWDDHAEKWAGETLMTGDVVYLEKIALSEYKGKRQGSAIDGSRVQICYRTVDTGRKEDKAYRPDLGLSWDQASVRVKGLAELAAQLG